MSFLKKSKINDCDLPEKIFLLLSLLNKKMEQIKN